MHHALQIPEILLHIFSNFHLDPSDFQLSYYYDRDTSSPLPVLARTCRAFKEPALDVLWTQLPHLCPLARCLPEASSGKRFPGRYFFHRPLTSAEWDVLRSYTSRTRSIYLVKPVGLSRKTLIGLSNPLTTEPLFPNVRSLHMDYGHNTKSLILLPLPSLISLDIHLQSTRFFENFLRSLAKTSPNLKTLSISSHARYALNMKCIEPSFIRRWQNLQIVNCHEISLDVNTLLHLSRMPSLTRLDFTLGNTLPDQLSPSHLPLILPTLDEFATTSESLGTVSRFISQARLPSVNNVSVVMRSLSSKHDLSIFFSTLQTSSNAQNVQKLLLEIHRYASAQRGDKSLLEFQDLAPCMVFGHLRLVDFNFTWKVALTEGELLMLASVWPHLEELSINKRWGWQTNGGITPDGVLQLLQRCPSLSRFALAIDTHGYIPSSPASLGLAVLRRVSSVDVVDSAIESECVPTVAAFFSGIVVSANFSFVAWDGSMGRWGLERDKYAARWKDMDKQCREMVARSNASELGSSGRRS